MRHVGTYNSLIIIHIKLNELRFNLISFNRRSALLYSIDARLSKVLQGSPSGVAATHDRRRRQPYPPRYTLSNETSCKISDDVVVIMFSFNRPPAAALSSTPQHLNHLPSLSQFPLRNSRLYSPPKTPSTSPSARLHRTMLRLEDDVVYFQVIVKVSRFFFVRNTICLKLRRPKKNSKSPFFVVWR